MVRQFKTKKALGVVALTLGVMAAPMSASAGDVGVSVSLDAVSEYVFRGVSFADTALQPGVEFSKGGFYLGGWTSLAVGEISPLADDEFDLYGGYGFSINDTIDASAGFTIFHFPTLGGGLFDFGGASSFEVSGGLSFNTPLSPAVTGYYDFNLDAFTLEGSVGHSFGLADKTSLDLGVTAGLVTGDVTDYEWATGSASVSYAVNDDSSLYIGGNLSLNSEDALGFRDSFTADGADGSLFWFGAGVSTSF